MLSKSEKFLEKIMPLKKGSSKETISQNIRTGEYAIVNFQNILLVVMSRFSDGQFAVYQPYSAAAACLDLTLSGDLFQKPGKYLIKKHYAVP